MRLPDLSPMLLVVVGVWVGLAFAGVLWIEAVIRELWRRRHENDG